MIDMTSVSVRFVLARISDPQTAKCDFYWSSGMDETTLFKFGNSQIMAKVYTPCALLSDTAKLANQLTNSHHWSLHFLYRTGCSEFHIIT